ncbi:MAG: SDR family oxidoreductase [Microbispora sp.]|nr:SDR family oxidoreductase [Microbispora sp.]
MPSPAHHDPENRVAVVTGAASGIGSATAELLAAKGVRVSAWDVDARFTAPASTAAERFLRLRVDVRDPRQVADAAAATCDQWGRIDLLVNSAGLFLVGPLEEVSADAVANLFEVNVIGTTLVTQACLPALAACRGAVVNLSSTVALKATKSNSHYAASKAAVAALTRCWALELAPKGIRVNAVAPGPTKTNIYHAAGMDEESQRRLLEGRKNDIPLGRIGTPEEIARWIVRLGLSDDWITGQVLAVDGGMCVA